MPNNKSLANNPNWVWGKDNYKSARGGGTPSGEENAFGDNVKVNPSGKDRGGWSKVGSPGKREDEQPRDAEGHFTYNAMIGKPLKDISKKDGKSRGKTVPPMLNGGVNGPEVSRDADGKISNPEFLEEWAGEWFEKGTEVAAFEAGSKGQTTIKIAPDDLFRITQEWVINKFGDKFELKAVTGGNDTFVQGKKDEGLRAGKQKHMIFVYKGTDTPVNFSELSNEDNKGEFGSGKAAEQKEGTAKETGDISKWQSKSGRPGLEEKQAKEEASQFSPYKPVQASGEDETDQMGGKLNKKYLEENPEERKQEIGKAPEQREDILPIPEDKRNDKKWQYSKNDVEGLFTAKDFNEINSIIEGSADPVMFEEAIRDTLGTILQEDPEDISLGAALNSGKFKDKDILTEILDKYNEIRQ